MCAVTNFMLFCCIRYVSINTIHFTPHFLFCYIVWYDRYTSAFARTPLRGNIPLKLTMKLSEFFFYMHTYKQILDSINVFSFKFEKNCPTEKEVIYNVTALLHKFRLIIIFYANNFWC